MADKAEKKPEAPAAPAPGEKKAAGGGALTKLPVLMGGAMILEAVILFAGFKFLGGAPKPVTAEVVGEQKKEGAEGGAAGGEVDKNAAVEIPVVDFHAQNRRNGHTFLYDVSIVLVTKNQSAEKVKKIVTDRGNLIRDRICTIIAQSDPEKLNGGSEPGRETLRRQVKFQLDEIVGEGLIDEVLVPKCIPFRADF